MIKTSGVPLQKRFYTIISVLFYSAFAVFLIAAVLTGSTCFGLCAFICIARAISQTIRIKQDRFHKKIAVPIAETIILILICTYLTMCDFGAGSGISTFYPFHRAYSASKCDIEDVLPRQLPTDVKEYSFHHMPSVMQGTGHTSVRCIFPEPYKYTGSADAVFMLSELPSYESGDITQELDKDHVCIYYDYEFWEGHQNTARVYVFGLKGNYNHPHSKAVITDTASGRTEFVRLG